MKQQQNQTVTQLFEKLVEDYPDNIAMVYEDKQFSYRELNIRANQFANYLNSRYAIQPDDLIALCLDRSEHVIIAILGILKAGGAYVPIDPHYPDERISYITGDTQVKIILTNKEYDDRLRCILSSNNLSTKVLVVDNPIFLNKLSEQKISNPIAAAKYNNLAYVIYTSGTTGKPKGVMIEHQSVISLAIDSGYVNITEHDSFLLLSNIAFDAVTFEIWAAILNGAKLVIPKDNMELVTRVALFKNILLEHQISCLLLTKTLFDQLLLTDITIFSELNNLIIGGEALDINLIKRLLKSQYAPNNIINGYGPTENTTFSCTLNISEFDLADLTSVPIGKSFNNRIAYVLNNNLELLPSGMVGELYVGGAGLARGYLNQIALTAEKFIPNPFQTAEEKLHHQNARLYKTGDLVRYLADDNIEYIGRTDSQVKIRGFRIELGEIEAALNDYLGIKKSVVVAREYQNGGNIESKYLLAYYIANNKIDDELLFPYLRSKLPEYMIPNVFVHIEKLPLTMNGKLDYHALPAPKLGGNVDNYVAPRNTLEFQIRLAFAEVLGLNAEQIGVQDNFFRLGGNSILAIKLVNELSAKNIINISVIALLQQSTIANIASSQTLDNISNNQELANQCDDRESNVLLATTEQLILSHLLVIGAESITYNESILIELDEMINHAQLENAVQRISAQFEVLHSNYITKMGQIHRVINKSPIICQEITDSSSSVAQVLKKLVTRQFNIRHDKLLRVYLFNEHNDITGKSNLILILHHLIVDATSIVNIIIPMLVRELKCMPARKFGHKQEIGRYTELVKQIASHYSLGLSKKEQYWQETLSVVNMISLPQTMSDTIKYGTLQSFVIPLSVTHELANCSKEFKLSIFSLLFSSFALALSKFYNVNDFMIRTNVDERVFCPGSAEVVGCFINNVLIRANIQDSEPLINFSNTIQDNLYAALKNLIPFDQLIALDRDKVIELSRISFTLETQENENLGYRQSQIYTHSGEIKNDLSFELDVKSNEILGRVEFNHEIFDQQFILSLQQTFVFILTNFLSNINTPIQRISLLPPSDYTKVVTSWNQTKQEYYEHKTIHEMFEEQVLRTPYNIAVRYNDIQLTYMELNQKANQLAHYLREAYDVRGDDLIALCLDRSEQILIAILGTLKSGAAYVPIDSAYPDERIIYILEDTQTKVILTNVAHESKLNNIVDSCIGRNDKSQKDNAVLLIDNQEFIRSILSAMPITNPEINITGLNLAYVIYTSGTTGKPKGVMLQHQGIVNRIMWMNSVYPLVESDKVLQKTPYVFDVSVWELFWANWYGASVVFAKPDGHKDSLYLLETIKQQQVTIVHFVPFMLDGFKQSIADKRELDNNSYQLQNLRYIFCSGEALNLHQVKGIQNLLDHTEIHNLYGPTEASIEVLYYPCTDGNLENIYIGRPIWNTTMYVLDKNLLPLPVGAIGELYVGGVGLARGYLNLPELTTERFIVNPFQSRKDKVLGQHSRLYKTGDLARYLPDGTLEYLGRNDFQVKVRGFRIELGEIENKLVKYYGIQQAVVLVKEQRDNSDQFTNKRLVAYYVSNNKINENSIWAYLSESLPDYMLPNALVHLEQLPLTINGKLDRKSLPEPEHFLQDDHVAPRNTFEARACAIYAEVLELDIQAIGVKDDFFRLGGNSILAIKLVSKLNNGLFKPDPTTSFADIIDTTYCTAPISIASIFKYRTIASLLESLTSADSSETIIIPRIPYNKKQIDHGLEKYAVLSFAQERLWFIDQYEPGTNTYNIPLLNKLVAGVNIQVLEQALQSTITRHEVLYSKMKTDHEGNWYQMVGDLAKEPFTIVKHCLNNADELSQLINTDVNHVFNLVNEYPIRVAFYSVNLSGVVTDYYLSIVVHHIAFDGWSTDVFLKEIQICYDHYLQQRNMNEAYKIPELLPELTVQYKDFAVWQKEHLSNGILDKQLGYWKNKLLGFESLNLPLDNLRPAAIDYMGEDVYFELDEVISNQLKEVARELNVSLYSVLLSGYYLFLSCYCNQTDIVIGTPIANRHYTQLENLIGLFVNSLVLRVKIDKNIRLMDFIQEVGKEVVDAQLHQDLPFEKLVEGLNIEKDSRRHPIFQIMFGVQSFGSLDISGTKLLEPYSGAIAHKIAKFDLSTFMDDSGKKLAGSFNYRVSLFNQSTVKGYIETYKEILTQVSNLCKLKPSQRQLKVRDINYLSRQQHHKILIGWNNTEHNYPDNKTIYQLVEEQVIKTPNNIALVYEDTKLTYQQLNERANQLAHYLRDACQVGSDNLILLCLNRSEHMLVAILGVLKSGAAYVPMDPGYPDERISYIVKDTQAKMVLTNAKYKLRFRDLLTANAIISVESGIHDSKNNAILHIDDPEFARDHLSTMPVTNPEINITGESLAYVIYTSGTTGQPKGVMIEHHSIVNLALMQGDAFFGGCSEDTYNCLWFSSYVFDAHVSEIYTVLVKGYTLYLIDENMRKDIGELQLYIKNNNIGIATIPPVLLDDNNLLPLKTLVVAGDRVKENVINYYAKNGIHVINAYGPTESTVCATLNHFTNNGYANIGRPIANITSYVLDEQLNPVPVGAVGELYIGGVGLARGYLNQAELTTKKFIYNPFQAKLEEEQAKNTRLYKTGDLVRYLADGNIEYMGRSDFQVKVRGYRIELGEIENILSTYPGVELAVVIACESKDIDGLVNGHIYLIGYYVGQKELDESAVLASLAEYLPEYMIPNMLVHLDRLPLTINGKLDRKALPIIPMFSRQVDGYIAPKTELEHQICNLWSETLNVPIDKVGLKDDFFKLGGNSILAIRLVSKLNQKLKLNLNVFNIFKYKNIRGILSNYSELPQIESVEFFSVEDQALSFAQERLWFIEQYESGSNAYNIPLLFKLTDECNKKFLFSSIRQILERHSVLRSIIKSAPNGNAYQEEQDAHGICIDELVVDTLSELHEGMKKQTNCIFKLESECPIRICLYKVENNKLTPKNAEEYISIVIHHIAFDGWSVEVFLKELNILYAYHEQAAKDVSVPILDLPDLKIKYKDFALWQRNYLSGEVLKQKLDYWQNELLNYKPVEIANDYIRPRYVNYAGADIYFEIDEHISGCLRGIASKLGVSLYSVLLSGYYLLLMTYTNQDDIVVGSPSSNRHYGQIEPLIGFFVNNLALRVKIDQNEKVMDYIKRVGNKIIDAQMHQDLPFEKLVDALQVNKDSSRHPIFQIMFSVQNFQSDVNKNSSLTKVLEPYSLIDNYQIAKFDLTTVMDDSQELIKGCFNYAVNIFTKETITKLIGTYQEILKYIALSNNKGELIKELNFIPDEDYKNIVHRWNCTESRISNKTIPQVFAEQVLRTPDAPAVIDVANNYSYATLFEDSQLVAKHIYKTCGESSNIQLIGVLSEKGYTQVVSTLAIMSAGFAYLPLSVEWPTSRVDNILTEGHVQTLLISRNQHQDNKMKAMFADKYKLIIIEDVLEDSSISATVPNIQLPQVRDTDIAYVIFTSGSTGKPKGVTISHRGAINTIDAVNKQFAVSSKDKVLALSELAFDLSVYDIFGLLAVGGSIVFPGQSRAKNPSHWLQLITQHQITIWNTVPQLASVLLEELDCHIKTLRLFLLSGDWIPINLPTEIKARCSNAKIISLGGATEGSIWSVWYEIKDISSDWKTIPYGLAMPNQKMYILNRSNQHCPVGVVGEIYIGGVGVALNYWRSEERTKSSFISHSELGRIYRTGDLGRWNKDGFIEFMGRMDNQVKLNGYRIELEEIEVKLNAYPRIKQSISLVKDSVNSKFLVSYYVSDTKLDNSLILNYLSQHLPAYMVPQVLIRINKLPLTINGKVDVKSLPEPKFDGVSNVLPRTLLEKQICQVCEEILGHSYDIGIRDDFFKIGGNSMLAIKFVSKLKNKLNVNIDIKHVFDYKTIEKIYDSVISQSNHSNSLVSSDYSDRGDYVLVNSIAKENPLFLLPPSEGGAESYLGNLCKFIPSHIPVVAFNSYFLNLSAEEQDVVTYEDLAKMYVISMKKIQPCGPYNIFGWSFGGILGYEIANQLIENGDEISNLFMLDSILNYKTMIDTHPDFSVNVFHTNNINYKYTCPDIGNKVRVILFKANKYINGNESRVAVYSKMIDFLNYIVESQPLNGLDKVLKDTCNLLVKPIDNDHIFWYLNEETVKYIAKEIELNIHCN